MLKSRFPSVTIRGGTGTARGWLHINLQAKNEKQNCSCSKNTYGIFERCAACIATSEKIQREARGIIAEAEIKKEIELGYYWDDYGSKISEMTIETGISL